MAPLDHIGQRSNSSIYFHRFLFSGLLILPGKAAPRPFSSRVSGHCRGARGQSVEERERGLVPVCSKKWLGVLGAKYPTPWLRSKAMTWPLSSPSTLEEGRERWNKTMEHFFIVDHRIASGGVLMG
ncbi:hypothetical protein NPIL_109491 [Nephila pilipes]|uniref:Uncharacterized protein n=1 Tax=Nephila pilipes TaxID=299642 RepID=A0A8X6TDA1_NEPPI|nr:hypothetical protein NPIL_109491 [Nephila pilipes]